MGRKIQIHGREEPPAPVFEIGSWVEIIAVYQTGDRAYVGRKGQIQAGRGERVTVRFAPEGWLYITSARFLKQIEEPPKEVELDAETALEAFQRLGVQPYATSAWELEGPPLPAPKGPLSILLNRVSGEPDE